MQNDRKLKLRLFAFLMVCALLVPKNGLFVASAEETAPVTAQAVTLQEGATVLTEAEPEPDGLSPDSATGYIEKENTVADDEAQDTGLSYQTLKFSEHIIPRNRPEICKVYF